MHQKATNLYVFAILCSLTASSVIARGSSRVALCGIGAECSYIWECRQQNGIPHQVCLKGFLLGTCCHLPRIVDDVPCTRLDCTITTENYPFKLTASSQLKKSRSSITPGLVKFITRLPLETTPLTPLMTSTARYESVVRLSTYRDIRTSTASITSPRILEWAHTPAISDKTPLLTIIKSSIQFTTTPKFSDEKTNVLDKIKLTKVPFHAKPTNIQMKRSTTQVTIPKMDYKNECGIRPLAFDGRIVGGSASSFGQWPWQVLVKEVAFLGFFSRNKCGGVLISSSFVLTAAHCKPGFFKNFLVVLGEYDPASEYELYPIVERNVRKVHQHPNFVPSTFENDLALLELDKPVEFQLHIVPICLPTTDEDFTGAMGFVSGFGRLSSGGRHASVLNHVSVPILSKKQCQEYFKASDTRVNVKDTYLCAGYKEGGKDSCEGDSGGPLAVERSNGRWVLAGIVSNGIKCALPNSPGIYTKISKFADWIKKKLS
uniref:Peptidase S1 domain-containing protein n=1 Tax=Strigamia maritima TaxID=126957 RepID=T1IWG7_STRMM